MTDQRDMFETLEQARDRLWAVLESEKGMDCPCCTRWAKFNTHHLHAGLAAGLIEIYKYFQRPDAEEWLHLEKFFFAGGRHQIHDAPRLRHWKLLEKEGGEAADGNPNRGYYRITDKGKQFVRRQIKVQQKVQVFDNTLMGLSEDILVTIDDCLEDKFNYDEMMNDTLNGEAPDAR